MYILAKSDPAITLQEHNGDLLKVQESLQGQFPALEKLTDSTFHTALKKAILYHDIGKSHADFQKLLRGKKNGWDNKRHEIFSFAFAMADESDWKNEIAMAVLGHHKDVKTLLERIPDSELEDDPELAGLLTNRRTWQDEINLLPLIEIEKALSATADKKYLERKQIRKYLQDYFHSSHPFEKSLRQILLSGALKICDHVGSARNFNLSKLEQSDFVFLEQKREQLKEKNQDFYEHQVNASKIIGNAILIAPTGSGKTETALLWAQKQVNQVPGHVFFVLPFTASINAMHGRLQKSFNDGQVGMIHGKLTDFLNRFFSERNYDLNKRVEEIKDLSYYYKNIHTPIKVVTPFQLLKHIFGLKDFEKGMVEWVGAKFIFDEIHAYDPEVIAQIQVFIEIVGKYFSAQVFIMTATLPTFLRTLLCGQLGSYSEVKASKELLDSFDRHRVNLLQGKLTDNIEMMTSTIVAGTKTLIVLNTVADAQQVYQQLLKDLPEEISETGVLLHGGFNGRDRARHEKKVIEGKALFIVGTQSIEVSLDIDYDVIFTAPAPLDALLQRFGRVNRNRQKGISDCYVFREAGERDKYIYSEEIIDGTLSTLKILEKDNGIISERRTQEMIDSVYPKWSSEQEAKYKQIYNLLKGSAEALKAHVYDSHTEEEFYKQFDGIPVLPVILQDEYLGYLQEKDLLNAATLFVSIRKNVFAWWSQTNKLVKVNYNNYESYYVTHVKYDPELGLLKDETEISDQFL